LTTEKIEVPDGGSIEPGGSLILHWWEESSLSELSVQNVVELVSGELTLSEVGVFALEHIGEANINPSVDGGNIGQLRLEEVKGWCVVPESTLEEESIGNSTNPVLVEVGGGRVGPELDHAVGSGGLLTNLVVGHQDGVDSSS
jgi:hypothetical protein